MRSSWSTGIGERDRFEALMEEARQRARRRRRIHGAIVIAVVMVIAVLAATVAINGSDGRGEQSTPVDGLVMDDFEYGSLEGWRHAGRGEGAWYVYDDGNSPPNPLMT